MAKIKLREFKDKHLRHKLAALTAAHVEGVVFVQGPAAQVGRHQLKAVHGSRPPLPLDGAGARLVLVTHRNWSRGVGRRRRKRKRKQKAYPHMSALRAMRGNNSNYSLLPKPLNPRPRVAVRNSTQRLRVRASRRRISARRPHQREIGEKWETPQSGAASLHERSLELAARPLGGNDTVCSSSTTANNHQHLILGFA